MFKEARLSCAKPVSFIDQVWSANFFPFILIGTLLLAVTIPRYLKARKSDLAHIEVQLTKLEFFKLSCYSLFLIYPVVSAVNMRLYNCRKIGLHEYLVAEMSILCGKDSEPWHSAALKNIFFVILWPIGIPVVYLGILWISRKKLHLVKNRASLGLLYDAYEHDCWWFEMADMGHKLFMTGLIVFIPQTSYMCVGMGVATLYLFIILWLKPYLRKGDDRLALLAQTEIILLLFSGEVFLRLDGISAAYEDIIGVILILMILSFLAFWIITTALVVYKRFERSPTGQAALAVLRKGKPPSKKEKETSLEIFEGMKIEIEKAELMKASMGKQFWDGAKAKSEVGGLI